MNQMRGHRTTLLLLSLLVFVVRSAAAGDESLNSRKTISLNTGSFVYHLYGQHEDFTQYFANRFVAIEARLRGGPVDGISVGTFINSFGNRCLLLGVQKNWLQLNRRTTFEGTYSYAGEFFFDAFADCGAEGYYQTFKKAAGVGFAPYVYHGIEYDLAPYASLEAGVLLPGVIVFSLQWHF